MASYRQAGRDPSLGGSEQKWGPEAEQRRPAHPLSQLPSQVAPAWPGSCSSPGRPGASGNWSEDGDLSCDEPSQGIY